MLQIWHKLNSSKPTWALPEPDGPTTTGFAGVDYYKMKVALVRLQVMTALPYESLGGAKERVRSGIAARVLSLKLPVIVLQKKFVKGSALPLLPEVRVHQMRIRHTPKTKGPIEKPELPGWPRADQSEASASAS